jgi:hypothetical protein
MTSDCAVWLYGSHARNEADQFSDVDILVVTDASSHIDQQFGDPEHASVYSWSQIEGMATYGSLFLLHLRMEGRPIVDSPAGNRRFRRILDCLPRYERVAADIRAFRQATSEARESIASAGNLVFELSILATTLRHVAILGCYCLGTPNFGRDSAFERFFVSIGRPQPDLEAARRLYGEYRNVVKTTKPVTVGLALGYCDLVDSVIQALEERVCAEHETVESVRVD